MEDEIDILSFKFLKLSIMGSLNKLDQLKNDEDRWANLYAEMAPFHRRYFILSVFNDILFLLWIVLAFKINRQFEIPMSSYLYYFILTLPFFRGMKNNKPLKLLKVIDLLLIIFIFSAYYSSSISGAIFSVIVFELSYSFMMNHLVRKAVSNNILLSSGIREAKK